MAQTNYDVHAKTVEALFSQNSIAFKVPFFQRPYAWTKEEIGQLLDDLFGDTNPSGHPYFLGSIVLVQQKNNSTENTVLVLDGQQRLSTLSLIIAVLIQKIEKNASTESDASDFRSYLFSRKLKGKRTPKIILQPSDAKIFEILIENPYDAIKPDIKRTALGSAIISIDELLDHYATATMTFQQSKEPYFDMLERLMYEVEVIEILTPSERDAFRLFETLNNRGLELNAADLIKNKLFSRCQDDLDDVIESWNQLLIYLKDENIVDFLRVYWISSYGFVRKDKLYDVYKNHIDSLTTKDAAVFALELEDAANKHQELVSPSVYKSIYGIETAESLLGLTESYKVRIGRPALLAAAKYHPEILPSLTKLCESITVRFSIAAAQNSNLLESMYSNISKEIRSSNFSWDNLISLSMFDSIPNDEDFKVYLTRAKITNPSSAWREILIQINAYLGKGEAKIDSATNVNIEHILPQNPSAEALYESGFSSEESLEYIPRLGNLTLISGTKNRKMTNKSFPDRKQFYKDSDIFITRELFNLPKWDRESIENRTLLLASAAVSRFPHPSKIKR